VKIERKAANSAFIPHDSYRVTKGYKIKDTINANAKGIRMVFARNRKAKNKNNVPIPKNRFLKESVMAGEILITLLVYNQFKSNTGESTIISNMRSDALRPYTQNIWRNLPENAVK